MAKSQSGNSLLKFRERKNSFTGSTSNPSKDNDQSQPKKYLRETGFNQMINEMIISTCQKYMNINLKKRWIFYCFLIIIGSILCDQAPGLIRAFVPIKTEKSSILNQYFVKIGWFWTLFFLIPFQCLARRSIDNSSKWYNLRDVIRIVIITLIWYLSINTFNYIEITTGKCTKFSIKSRRECLKSGWDWVGFDISGHTFLLLFSNMILFEESQIMNGFENFGYLLDGRNQELWKTTNRGCNHYAIYNKLLIPIRVLYILITLLTLLWNFMLFQTVLYYHSFLQKLFSFIWAFCCWYLCYRLLFLHTNLMPSKTPNKLENSN